jgi:hypothetical protein
MKTHVDRQIIVPLENRPGQLARLCRLLAERSINIEAISAIEGVEHGVVRMITSDKGECSQTLRENGFCVIEGDVLVIELTDKVGALAKLSSALAEAEINIDYLYGSVGQSGAPTHIILKAADLENSRKKIESLTEIIP